MIVIIVLSFFISKNLNLLRNFLYFLCTIIFVLFLDSSLQYFTGKNFIGQNLIDENTLRVSSFFGSELILGGYVSRILPIVLALMFFFQDQLKKKFTYQLFLIILVVFIISLYAGERIAVFQIAITSIYVLIFLNNNKIIKKYFVFFIIIFSIFVYFNESTTKKRLINHTIESFTDRDAGTNIDDKILMFSQVHHSHILSAKKMFFDSPFIGNGLKSFRVLCAKDEYKINDMSCTTHPHNTWLLFLSELGIIGFIFYFFSFFYFIKKFIFFSKNSKKPYSKSILCMIISILFYYLPIPSGSFFNNFFSYQFYFQVSFYLFFLNLFNEYSRKINGN